MMGFVDHPERWHRDRDQFAHWHRGPFWLRHRRGTGGPLSPWAPPSHSLFDTVSRTSSATAMVAMLK